jgi:hypothetical protein
VECSRILEILSGLDHGRSSVVSEREIAFLTEKTLVEVLSNVDYRQKKSEIAELPDLESKRTNLALETKAEVDVNCQLTIRLVSFWPKLWIIVWHGRRELRRLRKKVKVDRRNTFEKMKQCGGLYTRINRIQAVKAELERFVEANNVFLTISDEGSSVLEAMKARETRLEGVHYDIFVSDLEREKEVVRARYQKFSDTFFLLRTMKLEFFGDHLAQLALDISMSNGHARTLCERAYCFSRLFAIEGWEGSSCYDTISVLMMKEGPPEEITLRLKEAFLQRVAEGAPQNCATLYELALLDRFSLGDIGSRFDAGAITEAVGDMGENMFHVACVEHMVEQNAFRRHIDAKSFAFQIVAHAILEIRDAQAVICWQSENERPHAAEK